MNKYFMNHRREILKDLLIMMASLAGAALLCMLLRIMDQGDIYVSMIFLMAVAVVARFTNGPVYGVIASVIGVMGVNFAFTAPYFEFCLSIPGYLLSFGSMLAVSVATTAMISQIKNQEKQRYRAQVEEMRANLLRAVSHDLRTPLTSISGAASVLLDHPEMNVELRAKMLRDIADDSDWLVRMVENLLSITRINSTPASLHKNPEAAEEVMAESVRKFRKRFAQPPVDISVPDDLVMVPMDPILIEQVLTNLMENVVYHAQATQIRMNMKTNGDYAVFEISDDGIGIPPKRIADLFDAAVVRSSGVSDGARGMGIGLSVCKAIILAHGGTIEAENQPDGGACFRFRLPLKEDNHESHDNHSDC